MIRDNGRRPFYTEYAWAFDLLIDRPVRKDCAAIVAWLVERGVRPGADIVDAGCGTGRYSAELARRGYRVHGVDLSPELIAEARRSIDEWSASLSFSVGDISTLPANRSDAILCRGVLNDFVDDESRESAFTAFARSLRPGGVLILDVREWEATAVRKRREPLFRKSVDTPRGRLTFTSVTELDPQHRRLLVAENHTLDADGPEQSSDYQFVMRCWTTDELQTAFQRHGFDAVDYFGAYDAAVAPGATDRLVAVARI